MPTPEQDRAFRQGAKQRQRERQEEDKSQRVLERQEAREEKQTKQAAVLERQKNTAAVLERQKNSQDEERRTKRVAASDLWMKQEILRRAEERAEESADQEHANRQLAPPTVAVFVEGAAYAAIVIGVGAFLIGVFVAIVTKMWLPVFGGFITLAVCLFWAAIALFFAGIGRNLYCMARQVEDLTDFLKRSADSKPKGE